MPLELIVRSPKVIDFVEYEDREPLGDEILVQTLISGIKHGTELNMYRGTLPFANELWDPDLRLFRTPQAKEDDRAVLSPHPGLVGCRSSLECRTGCPHFQTRGSGPWRMEAPPNFHQTRESILSNPGAGRRGNDGVYRPCSLCTGCHPRRRNQAGRPGGYFWAGSDRHAGHPNGSPGRSNPGHCS